MRITNNVIMRNTKTNINGNKINVNSKNNQMSSQKKIDRPSEDPVIAVRALRLRSNLSELKQYLKTNIEEADSWMEITDTAIYNIRGLLNDMHTLADHGANDTLNQDDRNTILSQLRQNQEQIYAEGNADYAGRTVFTGWKTDTTLTFPRDTEDHYEIDQRLSFENLEENMYLYDQVTSGQISAFSSVRYDLTQDPDAVSIQRIRIAYDDLETTPAPVIYPIKNDGTVDATPGNEINYVMKTTAELEAAKYDIDSLAPTDGIILNTETGELLFTEAKAREFKENRTAFQITYDKKGFEKGDLTPENYFNCRKYNETDTAVDKSFIHIKENGDWIQEDINYTVATNQEMAINIEAKNVLNQDLSRDINDLADTVKAAIDAYDKVSKIEGMMKMDIYADPESQSKLSALLERANKEASYADDKMKKTFAHYVGKFQDYIDTAELARTDLGARGQRLSLTKNRVESQYNTVDKLKAENEDEDLSDIVIDYQAAYLAYQASLQAASKVQQQTLLDYI